jgi:hypothetical protein
MKSFLQDRVGMPVCPRLRVEIETFDKIFHLSFLICHFSLPSNSQRLGAATNQNGKCEMINGKSLVSFGVLLVLNVGQVEMPVPI